MSPEASWVNAHAIARYALQKGFNLEIVTYRDLESKSGLLPLMEQAFGWPFNEREFNRFIKIDPRLKNGVIGFCGLENGRVVSYVGAMDLATRTLDRTNEHAGGIYGVATLPGHTRQGYSTALFKVTHEYFKGKGYRFSFLNTSRARTSGINVKVRAFVTILL